MSGGNCYRRAEVEARSNRFTDAVISGDQQKLFGALEDPPFDEPLTKAAIMVDDAVEKIVLHAVPYFEEIEQERP